MAQATLGTAGSADDPLERYRRARDLAVAALGELEALQGQASVADADRDDAARLGASIARLRDGRFVLAVVGEFSSGKSFLLNALLGKVAYAEQLGRRRITGLLATDINPSTATITELVYAPDERATAFYSNGRQERIPLGRLARFVAVGTEAALHDATADDDAAPTLVRVGIDSAFLANGFVVADTPGLASINPAHRRATLSYLPGADAVLYLIDTQQPFSAGDASFLGIVRRYIESIFIVQTKIDLWRMRDAERETWQNACARIVAQAAIHAPDVPVFPLSAREYAEGVIEGNAELTAQSRFPQLLAALDASLVATTGRARLRRAAAEARRVATRSADALALDIAALELDAPALEAARSELEPALDLVDDACAAAFAAFGVLSDALQSATKARGVELRDTLRRTLGRTIDISDIARLRDRAKLHVLIDDALAAAVGRFAADVADLVATRLRTQARGAIERVIGAAREAPGAARLVSVLDTLAAERLPLTEDAAGVFGADPASGAWSVNLETGLRSTIVLDALGGPAVGLVTAIAERFAAAPVGTYMKRELLADLRTSLFPRFEDEIEAYVALNAQRVHAVATRLGERVGELGQRVRAASLPPLDRALEARQVGADIAGVIVQRREQSRAFEALATRVETLSETFARVARVARDERAEPHARLDLAPDSTRPGPAREARFDPQTYEHGLRPQRWRVAIVGALRRGKSGVINAIAGERLLGDEGGGGEMRFPVHVRYGAERKAYALSDDATWEPIGVDSVLDAAARTPVLVETPWRWPRELVLVHTPAFDSGLADAEQIALAAAGAASEVLGLFSRQLSDRELEMYERIARLNKPLAFVHTLSDNEEPSERRDVAALADRYLRERGIVPQRIFTVSAHEYRSAHEEHRVAAPWNEFGALVQTLETHAEEHMARLERMERERERNAALERTAAATAGVRRPSLFAKLFGKK